MAPGQGSATALFSRLVGMRIPRGTCQKEGTDSPPPQDGIRTWSGGIDCTAKIPIV